MRKVLTFLFIFLLLVNSTVCYAKQRKFKAGIIFNDVPFSVETAGNYKRSFKRGERIYWLLMSKKPFKAQFIEVQVFSVASKTGWMTLGGVTYTHDYRLNLDSPHYFTDYFVIHAPGHYYMQVFDKNDLIKPITYADFFVR